MINVQNTYRGQFVSYSDEITIPSSASRTTTYTCQKAGIYHIKIISISTGVANQDGYLKIAGVTIFSSAYTSQFKIDSDYTLAEGDTIEIKMGSASSSGGGNGFAMLIYKS